VLAVQDNQQTLADSMRDFFAQFKAAPERMPHALAETVEKDHGGIETRRCFAFNQWDCLAKPEQWPDLKSFAVIEPERHINGQSSLERASTSAACRRMPSDWPERYARIGRWKTSCIVVWMSPSRTIRCALVPVMPPITHITFNLIRLDPVKGKGGIKARRLIAATSDAYRAELLGLA